MGIQGLLPRLKSIMSPINVEELHGQRVAVDTYSWLHKGALCCSRDLCKGLPTFRHIDYCMHRVNLLRHHGVKPILVFDGGLLPMKIEQETKRARVRKENLERALEHEALGNSSASYDCYQKAVDISPSIAHQLIEVLNKEKVDYIVAPYEADAQMTFLSINGFVDAVITEDSDLIPFGCSRIIFKMDKFGEGVEFRISNLKNNTEIDLSGFSNVMLLEMCIFSGCDYLPSLPGMGVKRAHALVQKFKNYEKVIKHLRYSSVIVPQQYEKAFEKAMWAFQYQRVYDPIKQDLVHLHDIPDGFSFNMDFLGPWLPQDVAKGIADGKLDPIMQKPFKEAENSQITLHKSYSGKDFVLSSSTKKLDLPVQKNVLTNYFCLASLQAKRRFLAPRVNQVRERVMPIVSSQGQASSEEDKAKTTNELHPCQLESKEPADGPSSPHHVDDGNYLVKYENPSENHNNFKVKFSYQNVENEVPDPPPGSVEGKNTENSAIRKVFIRSKYFHQNLSHEKDNIGNQQHTKSIQLRSRMGVLNSCPMSRSASLKNLYTGSDTKKRKLLDQQHVHMACSLLSEDVGGTSLLVEKGENAEHARSIGSEDRREGSRERGNFGCDISHLDNYSAIAGASLERFAALVSSFRYIHPSGSRASGLRAPLKDARNTLA